MFRQLRHRHTKGAATVESGLTLPRHISTLPTSSRLDLVEFFLDDLFCTLMSKLLVLLIPAYSARISMPIQALGRAIMYVKPAILNPGVR